MIYIKAKAIYIKDKVRDCPVLEKDWDDRLDFDRGGDPLYSMTHSEFLEAMDGDAGEQTFRRMLDACREGDQVEAFRILERRLREYLEWMDEEC